MKNEEGTMARNVWIVAFLCALLGLLLISGCGLFQSGPNGELAPILFGFDRMLDHLPDPGQTTGTFSWLAALTTAAVAGLGAMFKQSRTNKKARDDVDMARHEIDELKNGTPK